MSLYLIRKLYQDEREKALAELKTIEQKHNMLKVGLGLFLCND